MQHGTIMSTRPSILPPCPPEALPPGVLVGSLPPSLPPLPLVAFVAAGLSSVFLAVALPPFLPPSDCAFLPAALTAPDLPASANQGRVGVAKR